MIFSGLSGTPVYICLFTSPLITKKHWRLYLCVAMGDATEELSGCTVRELNMYAAWQLHINILGTYILTREASKPCISDFAVGFRVLGRHFWTELGTKKKQFCHELRSSSRCPETGCTSNIWVYGSGLLNTLNLGDSFLKFHLLHRVNNVN